MEQVLAWVHSLPNDIIGYIAGALVLATFSQTSMRSLRMTAIASNMAFILYACLADMRPILILHSILLPVNIIRLMQISPVAGSIARIVPIGRWR